MLKINNKEISYNQPTYIISEIGINHNGSFDLAMKMIEEAAQSGVDAVKVQIITAAISYAKTSPSYEIFKNVEFSPDQWQKLVEKATSLNIDVFSTFVSIDDLHYVEKLNLPAIKISSTNITNFPLLEAIAQLNKPIIMSTGMAYLSEVDEAVRFLEEKGVSQMGILQCTALYPTQPQDVNLLTINTLLSAFPQHFIGFSDHTLGNHCTVASIAMGARIIEKHFTLDRNMEGPDHHFSATPAELTELVHMVRSTEIAMGSSIKKPVSEEINLRSNFQRGLVAAVDLKEGEILDSKKIVAKRSSTKGILPKYMNIVIGRTLKRDIPHDASITWDAI